MWLQKPRRRACLSIRKITLLTKTFDHGSPQIVTSLSLFVKGDKGDFVRAQHAAPKTRNLTTNYTNFP